MSARSPTPVRPSTKEELFALIHQAIDLGTTSCSLNHIDVSLITNMDNLFANTNFCGDVSQWDVSNVVSMKGMFKGSLLDGDISQWNVSKVKNMQQMFYGVWFNGDISQWDVSNVVDMSEMFMRSDFKGNISQWNVSNVRSMKNMFFYSDFQGDLASWQYHPEVDCTNMFDHQRLSGWVHPFPTPAHWLCAEEQRLSGQSPFYAHYQQHKAMVECLGTSAAMRAGLFQQLWVGEHLVENTKRFEHTEIDGSLFESMADHGPASLQS